MDLTPAGVFHHCIVPALWEEALFRGVLLLKFAERFSRKKAVFLTSLAFASIHGSLRQGIYAFFMGLFLGWLVVRRKSLWLAIFLHFFHNFLYLAWH